MSLFWQDIDIQDPGLSGGFGWIPQVAHLFKKKKKKAPALRDGVND